jgi:hypothetical protein
MSNAILLENLTPDNLKEIIKVAVREELAAIPQKKEDKFLTRGEVRKIYHISLPTIDKRIRDGSLKGYRIGDRVLMKESEINLPEIPVRKYR